jgi:hypothetical protein
VVFARNEADDEYFTARPEAKFRLKLHRSRWHSPDSFDFKVVTRDPKVFAIGDRWDLRDYAANRYGSPREYWMSECERMLADPNRCVGGSERWLASQGTHQ